MPVTIIDPQIALIVIDLQKGILGGPLAHRTELTSVHWLPLLSYFFGGVFSANAIPHLVSGVMGRPFQTPFAKPPGKGLSSSTVNALWGFFNAAIGYVNTSGPPAQRRLEQCRVVF